MAPAFDSKPLLKLLLCIVLDAIVRSSSIVDDKMDYVGDDQLVMGGSA